jgi:hypothetical protein
MLPNINQDQPTNGDTDMTKDEKMFHWAQAGMPEYSQEKQEPFKKLTIRFGTAEDYARFEELIGQPLTDKTKAIWYPRLDRYKNKGVVYVS